VLLFFPVLTPTFFGFSFGFGTEMEVRLEVEAEMEVEMEAGAGGPTCCLACVRSRVVIADAVCQHLFWGRLSMVDAPLSPTLRKNIIVH